MATYVVVDSNNRWLFYGDAETPEDAFKEAQEADDYDPEAALYAYEVVSEHRVP